MYKPENEMFYTDENGEKSDSGLYEEDLEDDTQGIEYPLELRKELKLVAMECGLTDEQAELIYPCEEPHMQTETNSLYTYEATIKQLNDVIKTDPAKLYKSACVNRKGNIRDADKAPFTEVISKELLIYYGIDKLAIIPIIRRKKPYRMHNKRTTISDKKNLRKEEREAIRLFNEGFDGMSLPFGKIVEYQIPIKGKMADEAGKIDLAAITPDNKTLYIIELKIEGIKDTLLRALLEIETYSRQIDLSKLKMEFNKNGYEIITIEKALLLYPGCNAHKEYQEMQNGMRPAVKKLLEEFKIQVFDSVETKS